MVMALLYLDDKIIFDLWKTFEHLNAHMNRVFYKSLEAAILVRYYRT